MLWISGIVFVRAAYPAPDQIVGTFNELKIMEETADAEKQPHAVGVIRYVRLTPAGELFSVDTESNKIEVLVTLRDKKMLAKPLQSRSDQKILVDYHRRIKAYADEYERIVQDIVKAGYRVEGADLTRARFVRLAQKYPGFSSAYRGEGVALLAAGNWSEAVGAFTEALKENPEDATARALLGMTYVASDNSTKAEREATIVKKLDVQKEHLMTWEAKVVEKSKPDLLSKWTTLYGGM
jgi:tetratricopeptide (TPR) repeat protein